MILYIGQHFFNPDHNSGGPLIAQMEPKSNGSGSSGLRRYSQIGVTSWGFGCAIKLNPGVFARVSEFLYWIRMHTVDSTFCQE